jgi:hypothetical protein
MQRVDRSNVLMILQEERDLDSMYSNRSLRVLQNPHLIHTTPRITSVTVTLKLGFEMEFIKSKVNFPQAKVTLADGVYHV